MEIKGLDHLIQVTEWSVISERVVADPLDRYKVVMMHCTFS